MTYPEPAALRRQEIVERTIARVRVGVVTGAYLLVLLGGDDSRSYMNAAVVIISAAAVYAVLMTLPSLALSRHASSIIDLIFTVGIIASTGAGRSPAIGILFLVVASTALRFSPVVARVTAIAGSISLALVVIWTPRPDLPIALRIEVTLGWSVTLLFAAVLSALLADLEMRERTELVVARERATALAEADAARRRTLSMVAHDLTPPIAAIQGIGRTLTDPSVQLADGARSEALAILLEHASHLQGFTASIRDVAHAGDLTKLQRPRTVRVDLHQFLEGVCRLEAFGPERKVSLEIIGSLPEVEVDSQKLRRILINLIENALRHSPSDQPVVVTARESTVGVALTVADLGPGIAESAIDKVFTANWQGEANTGELGLGLWIVAEFTRELGGTVTATNVPSGGLEVTVGFPRAQGPPVYGP